jgi:opacity protein-like surface antigen
MLRRLAAAFVVVAAIPATVVAQNAVITVTTASADVHKSPSTGSPVIGHAVRGAQLPVTRELGSWVRVAWPSAPDGVGFLHVSMGRIANAAPAEEVRAAAGDAVRAIPEKTAAATLQPVADRTPRPSQRRAYDTPVPHVVGIGGGILAASPVGFGVTARAWQWRRVGMRFDLSRQSQGVAATSHATSLQFEPSAIVSLNDYITNYVWLRPYAGAGISFRHQTFTTGVTGASNSLSDNSTGYQLFGGTEVTVANAPQLAVGADVIYRSDRDAFGVFDVGGVGIGLSAHWYFR